MQTNEEINEMILDLIIKKLPDCHTITRIDHRLILNAPNIEISSEIVQKSPHPQGYVVQIIISIFHPVLVDGIKDPAVGTGKSIEEAVEKAIDLWLDSVFPVVLEFFQFRKNPNVKTSELGSFQYESKQILYWKLYLGTLQIAGYTEEEAKNLDDKVILRALLENITDLLTEKKIIHLKCSLTRSQDEIYCDCWLNNEKWLDGLNSLNRMVQEWPKYENLHWQSQFFIFKPCQREELENPKLVDESMEALIADLSNEIPEMEETDNESSSA